MLHYHIATGPTGGRQQRHPHTQAGGRAVGIRDDQRQAGKGDTQRQHLQALDSFVGQYQCQQYSKENLHLQDQ